MVGLAVALRLTLLRGALRSGPGSTGRQLGFVLGLLGGVVLAGLGFALLATQGSADATRDAATVLFTAALVGWAVLPVLTFSSDDLLDPSKLALLPLTRRQLGTLLLVGGLVGVAPVATLVAALGLAVGAGRDAAPVAVALVAAVLLVLLCVAVSRLVVVSLSGLLRSRRGRDLGVALGLVVALSFQLVNPLVQRMVQSGTSWSGVLADLASPLRWSPTGLLAGAPAMAARGELVQAVGALLLVGALTAGVVLVWQQVAAAAQVRPDRSGSRSRRTGALVPALVRLLLGNGRTAAVAAKDLRYLTRDPRRLVSTLSLLLFPAVAVLAAPLYGFDGGLRPGMVFAVCLVALFAGLTGSNRFGADGTAAWVLAASHADPRDARRDLLGGDVATVLTTAPLLLVLAVGVAVLSGGERHLPAATGAAAAVLLVGTGASAWVSVRAPYAVPDAPGNAFSGGGAGQGCLAGLLGLAAMLAVSVLCLPLLALLLPALDSTAWGVVLLLTGPLYGAAVATVLRRVAARDWERRAPEVLQTLAAAG